MAWRYNLPKCPVSPADRGEFMKPQYNPTTGERENQETDPAYFTSSVSTVREVIKTALVNARCTSRDTTVVTDSTANVLNVVMAALASIVSTPSASAGPQAETVNEPVAWQYRERGSFWRHCDVVTNDPAIEFRPLYDHPQPTHSQLDAIEDEIEKWSKDTRSNYPATEVAESFVRILEAAQPQQADGCGAVIEALAVDFENSVHHVWDNQEVADRLRALSQAPASDGPAK